MPSARSALDAGARRIAERAVHGGTTGRGLRRAIVQSVRDAIDASDPAGERGAALSAAELAALARQIEIWFAELDASAARANTRSALALFLARPARAPGPGADLSGFAQSAVRL